MKQLVQYASSGEVRLVEAPRPSPKPREVLVRTLASAVSTGTERGNLSFARASLVEKAKRRPDLVEKVVTKALQQGPLTAYREARSRLEEPFPLGYSSAGVVEELGEGADQFRPGQIVACSGARFATHAEFVAVPETMCAPVPETVSPEDAAFAALAAVVIHAMRRGGVEMGSRVAVVGLGVLGLLAIQIAKAAGAVALGADISKDRCDLALDLGADIAVVPDEASAEQVRGFCGPSGGADVVIVTATSHTNEPFVWAAQIARERGHLVVVGNFPPDLPRRLGYDKELTVEFSRAWGPGTYDPEFYLRGHSEGYPISLVRWTAPQNMRTYLELVSFGRVSARRLVTHRFPIEQAVKAYETLDDPSQAPLGVLITYAEKETSDDVRETQRPHSGAPSSTQGSTEGKLSDLQPTSSSTTGLTARRQAAGTPKKILRLGIIGAGNHVSSTLAPAIASLKNIQLKAICSPSGLKAAELSRKYGIGAVYSRPEDLLERDDLDAVLLATRHDSHARLALDALSKEKNVLVEKPLALKAEDIDAIEKKALEKGLIVFVGFNRRFSPLTRLAIDHVRQEGSGPYYISIRANPGPLEKGHWVLDPVQGGGRLLSEGCHFFDLACALCGSNPQEVTASMREPGTEEWLQGFAALVEFSDGSLSSLTYAGAGPLSFGKERFEIIGTSKAATVVDFKVAYLSGKFKRRTKRKFSAQKGFPEMLDSFTRACTNPYDTMTIRQMQEMFDSSRLAIAADLSARIGERVKLQKAKKKS